MSYDTAADAILALINSKPRSPTKDELVAIIAKAAPSHLLSVAVRFQPIEVGAREELEAFDPPRLRGEWDELATEMLATDAKLCAIARAADGCTDAVLAAEDEASEVQGRFNNCARRILKEPVRNQSDLMLLAEACYWWLYTDPAGLWAPKAEAQLAGAPAHAIVEGGVCEEAVVALLKGVRDVGMPLPAAISPSTAPTESDPTTQELPFMSHDRRDNSLHGNGICYWDVKASGDWGEDDLVGQEYARMYLDSIRHGEQRPELWWIVRDMIVAGRCTGVECGFIQRVFAHLREAITN